MSADSNLDMEFSCFEECELNKELIFFNELYGAKPFGYRWANIDLHANN